MKNNKEGLSLLKRVGKKAYKIFTFFIIIVLIMSSVGIYCCSNLGMGYEYYKVINEQSSLVGITQEENIVVDTIDDYLLELAEKGYYIVTSDLDIELFCNKTIVNKRKINDEIIKQTVISSLNIEVLSTKLNIENDPTTYYFKTETECQDFVKELNKYIEQKYTTESVVENYNKITTEDVLNTKVQAVMQEKAENDKKAEEARQAREREKVQVTSRGGNVTRNISGPPLASYVYVSSPYGMRHGKMHTGMDFAAAAGTSVYAWKSGKVVSACWSGGYGNFIIVEHNDGTVSRYAHLSGYAVSAGQTVSKGQTIGYVGSTGNSTGPHLHFEIKVNENFVNPANYL